MAKIVQYNIFGEAEPVEVAPRGYDAFVAKFKRKKTTDDCYTPPAVYDAVLRYVDERVMPLDGLEVLRPFKPGGDYLTERYGEITVVIDNAITAKWVCASSCLRRPLQCLCRVLLCNTLLPGLMWSIKTAQRFGLVL